MPLDGESITLDGVATQKFLAFLSACDETLANLNTAVAAINATLAAAKSLHKYTVLTASDSSWEPDPATTAIRFTVVGAGGGGGGTNGAGAGSAASGDGGGGGATVIKFDDVVYDSYNITVGIGGSGGASGTNDGSPGTTSQVTPNAASTWVASAGGGAGGAGRAGGSNQAFIGNGVGGVGSGGDLNLPGTKSTSPWVISGRPAITQSGCAAMLSGGVTSVRDAAGATATTPGAGGGSSHSINIGTNYAGGDGANGVVIIEEYTL